MITALVTLVNLSAEIALADVLEPVPVLPTAGVKPVDTIPVIFQEITVGPLASCPKPTPMAASLHTAVAVDEAITGSGSMGTVMVYSFPTQLPPVGVTV